MIDDAVRELAKADNFGVLSTILPSGRIQAQVVWVDCDDECVLVNTEVHRKKFENVELDPRATVVVWERSDPYRYVEVRGSVVETVRGDQARRHIDELSLKYRGRPYDPDRIKSERVVLRIRPDRQLVYRGPGSRQAPAGGGGVVD